MSGICETCPMPSHKGRHAADNLCRMMRHVDDLARQMRLDVEIARLSRPGMTAAEMAEQLPEDLRSLYWRGRLDAYFDAELAES